MCFVTHSDGRFGGEETEFVSQTHEMPKNAVRKRPMNSFDDDRLARLARRWSRVWPIVGDFKSKVLSAQTLTFGSGALGLDAGQFSVNIFA